MKRWIQGLSPVANLLAIICIGLLIAAGVCIGIIVIAERLAPTNGSAGVLPAVVAACFLAAVALLYLLIRGKLWARVVFTVLSLAAWIGGLVVVTTNPPIAGGIVAFFGGIIILSSLGLGLLWSPIPERNKTQPHTLNESEE
ncbi:MAG TPA: hypothetical protein GX530_04445 [Corynebacteriales bacterium]|nr:hypothetical protein [Mycobacteriales bacterium]